MKKFEYFHYYFTPKNWRFIISTKDRFGLRDDEIIIWIGPFMLIWTNLPF